MRRGTYTCEADLFLLCLAIAMVLVISLGGYDDLADISENLGEIRERLSGRSGENVSGETWSTASRQSSACS
jgi:hypothetical protein